MHVFSSTVWAKDGEFGVRPIGSVQEAQIFLDGWPVEKRGPLYYAAANSLQSAEEGSIPPDVAKASLIEFLAHSGALTEDRFQT